MGSVPPRCNVLGVGVHAVNMHAAVETIAAALERGQKGYVCVSPVHPIVEAWRDETFRSILNQSLLTTPDGMPLVWAGRMQGFREMERVYGPDLMLAVCGLSVGKGWTHFLYGGADDGVLEALKTFLAGKFPGIRIVGTYRPPFRPLTEEEDKRLVSLVARLRPDFFWVGVGCPKQERFMAEYLPKLDTKIMLGVGAAFDIHTGRTKDAPAWIKKIGMQWFHRLCHEPGRLWTRYAYTVPAFLILITLQLLRLKRYGKEQQ